MGAVSNIINMRMKVALISLASLAALGLGAPVPDADPEAFLNLGAVAIPAITGSALIDGLLLGKVAFLKAAILANLLLGSESSDEASYGAPASAYEEPADTYGAPYEAPVETYETPVATYEEPADEYGSPAAAPVSYSEPLPSYGAPARF